ncbi:MAG: hypothetical protein LIO53_04415 [Oscillospiraceae bacterium]|nr:hypothetical protein [Oscillospiraceae bacterium]MCC8172898.1 hypothetical protein [Odoribacter sp.]
MLYKPNFPTPYITSPLDPCGDVNFSAVCNNTAEITKMRLTVDSGNVKYYYPFEITDSADGYGAYISDGGIGFNIQADTDYSDSAYKVVTSNGVRTNSLSSPHYMCGNSDNSPLLVSPKNYTWQVRLYQENCTTNIAYGFVQEVYDASDYTCYSSSATHILKVRPHTNMFFKVDSTFNNGLSEYSSTLYRTSVNYYDDNVKYQLSINGQTYDILAYYYGRSSNTGNANYMLSQLDSYGNALYAYFEISATDDDISVDDQYSVYANYIDSNEFYFTCHSTPTLTLYDKSLSTSTEIQSFADGTEPDSEENIYTIPYGNFVLSGTYLQEENATVNYYRIVLYQELDTGDYLTIDDTGNVYSSSISYSFDRFFSGETYKLILQTVDTDRNTLYKSIFIVPDYGAETIPKDLNVGYYSEHKSIIIDFTDLISITGHELNEGDHEYKTIVIDSDGTIISDETVTLLSVSEITACEIYEGNTVTYDYIDGSLKALSCENPLLSMVVKGNLNNNSQQIFYLVDDNGYEYSLKWTGISFFTLRVRIIYLQDLNIHHFQLLIQVAALQLKLLI